MPRESVMNVGPSVLNFGETETPTQRTTYVLARETSVFERVGTLCSLPRGTQLEVTGVGFSDGTLRVQSNGVSYVVFLRDLE